MDLLALLCHQISLRVCADFHHLIRKYTDRWQKRKLEFLKALFPTVMEAYYIYEEFNFHYLLRISPRG